MATCGAAGMEMMVPLLSGSHQEPFTSFLRGICDHVDGFLHNHFYIEGYICVSLSGICVSLSGVYVYSVFSLIKSTSLLIKY